MFTGEPVPVKKV